ncbi:MAG TPA: family 16 glycoside hydrolase [Opitutaceae bacterium]
MPLLLLLPAHSASAAGVPDQAPPIPISGLSGVTFLTADFAPLERFYGHGAGLREEPMGRDDIRFQIGTSQWIEFRKVPRANWTRRLQYVTLEAADLDRVAAGLRARGVAASWIHPDPQTRILQLADPAGNVIRVAEPQASRAAPGAPGTPAFSDHLQHFGFAVPSALAAATTAFYEEKLGFAEAVNLKAKGGKTALVKFWIPGPKGDMIELIFFDPPLNKWAAGAFDHVDFQVSDINAAYRQLHRGGIATLSRHLPTVNGEHLWAIDIFDPELTRMEIQAIKPATAPIGSISTVGGESARPLFDGRTLDGWEGNLANWRVEDGAIVAGALDRRQPYNEFLATTADFGDFELRLQYKVEGTGGFVNGGVQFWSQRVPASYEVSGFQADLGAGTDGNLYDESRRNSNLATAPANVREMALKPGAWNDYRIRAVGPHIEIWLNGLKTVDYMETDKAIPLHGRFALQIHGRANTKVSYRDIEVETFTRAEPAP